MEIKKSTLTRLVTRVAKIWVWLNDFDSVEIVIRVTRKRIV